MDKKQAEKRIKELREKTEYYAKKYYDDDNPEITDYEYDMMMLELRNIEKEYPELITKKLTNTKSRRTRKRRISKIRARSTTTKPTRRIQLWRNRSI